MDTATKTEAPEADELAITELLEFEPDRLDGVKAGATGIGFLMMKAAVPAETAKGARSCPKCKKDYDADHTGEKCENCGTTLPAKPDAAKSLPEWLAELTKAIVRGKVDETQDLELAKQILALLGKAISLEADELAAGHMGEITDIRMLTDAVSMIKYWQAREQAVADGQDPDDSMLMCSVAVPAGMSTEDVAKAVAGLAEGIELTTTITTDGKQVARTAAAATLAAAKKSATIAEGGTTVDTVTSDEGTLTKSDLAEAVTKATEPLKAEIASLQGQVAKVLALPQPGGPVLALTQPPKKAGPDADDLAAKAAGYRVKAEQVTDPQLADGYRQLALEADDKAAALR